MNIKSAWRELWRRPPKQSAATPAQPKAMEGGSGNRPRRFYGQIYSGGLATDRPTLLLDSASARDNIRALYHKSPQAAALINRGVQTVAGSGLRVIPAIRHDILGKTMEEAKVWNKNAREMFDLWAEDKKASLNGKMNFYQMQPLLMLQKKRDGEYFATLNYSGEKNLQNPLRIGLIDTAQVRDYQYFSTGGINPRYKNTFDGIEYNDNGEETKIHVWYNGPAGGPIERTILRVGPSERVHYVHGFTPQYAGQNRGFPELAACIQDLEKILDLTTAETVKAINQASLWAIGVTKGDTRGPDPMGQRVYELGQASYELGATPNPAPAAENVTEESTRPLMEYIEADKRDILQPGMSWMGLEKGQEVVFPTATSPSQSYNAFIESLMTWACAANGQSMEHIIMRYNANYSASRATLIQIWRIATQERYEFAQDFLFVVYRAWLSESIAAGKISCPGWLDPTLKNAWSFAVVQGESMINIDPVKEASASKLYRDMGAVTGEEIAQLYNGSSFEANVAQLAEEMPALNAAIPIANTADKTYVEEKEEPNSNAKSGGKQ
ncbi:phage portal protein [Spirochaetia bacterium]|nr:phage portal protein [Spirochaetia bacterium]